MTKTLNKYYNQIEKKTLDKYYMQNLSTLLTKPCAQITGVAVNDT